MTAPITPDNTLITKRLPKVGTTSPYAGMVAQAANALNTGPDRKGMAMTALADFDAASAERQANSFKAVGQNAARLGRIGSGAVTKDLGVVQRQIAGDRSRFQNDLVRDLTERDRADQFQKVGVFAGLDRDAYGRSRDAVNDFATDRAYEYGMSRDAVADNFAKANLGLNQSNTQFNQRLALQQLLNSVKDKALRAKLEASMGAGATAADAFGGAAAVARTAGAGAATPPTFPVVGRNAAPTPPIDFTALNPEWR